MNESILDSHSRLSNLKGRMGLRIAQSSSVAIYTSQKKLSRFLNDQFQDDFKYKDERLLAIDKIVDRCDTIETINNMYSYIKNHSVKEFIDLSKGKIRVLFSTINNS